MAYRLVNAAYGATRDTGVSVERVAQQTVILLQAAARLDPENVHTLRLLVEASRGAGGEGSLDLQRDTLRQIVRLDPGDLVSQVAYLDAVAAGSQVLDERARVYKAALDSTGLNAQIRSQMAVRLARLAMEREDVDGARAYLKQAVTLNDVNVEALRELARLADRAPAAHLKAIIALLLVNPYQPDAWLGAASVAGAAGLHERAAEFLNTAIEQIFLSSGQPGDGNLYLQLAIELATAGRLSEAYPILRSLSSLEDAPVSAMMAASLLAMEYKPPAPMVKPAAATRPAESQPGAAPATMPEVVNPDELAKRLTKRLADSIAANPKSASALAEAVWVQSSGMAEVVPETAEWLKSYEGLVKADDATLLRLKGWALLREKKFAEAEAALEKLAANDPLAQLGLARALIEQNKIPAATKQLQEMWSSFPTGLLALQVAHMARGAGIKLAETARAREVAEVLRTLPANVVTAHREPRDLVLIIGNIVKRTHAAGEPVMVQLRISNTSNRTLPVGPDGVVKTTVGLTARTRSLNAQNMGMYVVEDLHRVYRLEKRESLQATIRADVSTLGDVFQMNPMQQMDLTLGLVAAPRGGAKNALPGLGGQQVVVGDFERAGVPMQLEPLAKMVKDAPGLPLDQQMARAEMMAVLLLGIPAEYKAEPKNEAEKKQRESLAALREGIMSTMLEFAKSPSPLLRATVVQVFPEAMASGDIQVAIDSMIRDPDPLVRMLAGMRSIAVTHHKPEGWEAGLSRIEKAMETEQDATVKAFWKLRVEDERARGAAKPEAKKEGAGR
jgi:tetratricopeptide (TPR) repeat protein